MIGLFELLVIGLIGLVIFAATRQSFASPQAAKPTRPLRTEKVETSAARNNGDLTSFLRSSLTGQVPRALLVVIRLVQGPMWLGTGWYWLTADTAAEMTQQISGVIESGRPYAFFLPFLEDTVLPYILVFAVLVTMGELFVGLSLTFGVATRLGAAVGMFLAFNYACLYGNTLLPVEGNWLYFCYLIPVLVGAAGRSFGLDYWLHQRWPHLPIW